MKPLSINTLRACVYIYIRQLSSFKAPTWFIDLTVASCHIQCTFLSFCQFLFTKKRTNLEPFSYDTKMAPDGYWARKALINREGSFNCPPKNLNSQPRVSFDFNEELFKSGKPQCEVSNLWAGSVRYERYIRKCEPHSCLSINALRV